jgi:hypothetical protein
MDDGTGLAGVIPPLAEADFLVKNQDQLPCIIRKGIKGELIVNGRIYNTEMPGTTALTEFEITNIINYMNTAWGNGLGIVKHESVRNLLKTCP